MRRSAVAVTAVVALLTAFVSGFSLTHTINAANASDKPYTVTKDGIQLNGGRTFEDNGHVNVRLSSGVTKNAHFESKCITRTDAECAGQRHAMAQYIGKSFMPWSALGITKEDCIEWVQKSGENYHFGEHGEKPICCSSTPSEPPETEPPTETPPTEEPPTEPPVTEPPVTEPPTPTEPPVTDPPTTDPPTSPPTTPSTPDEPEEPENPTPPVDTPDEPKDDSSQSLECIDGTWVTVTNGKVTSKAGSCDTDSSTPSTPVQNYQEEGL